MTELPARVCVGESGEAVRKLKRMNLLLLGDPHKSLSVWYSAQTHLDYLQQCGEKITVFLPQQHRANLDSSWITGFRADLVVPFKNFADLCFKLRKSKSRNHFCLTWKEVLMTRVLLSFVSRQTFYWYQGIVPEEDFLRTGNKLRKNLLFGLDRAALKQSDKTILVSNYMKDYVEKTRRLSVRNPIVVPCSSNLHYKPAPRQKNSFVYVGGLTVWQRLDRVLKMYATIAKRLPDSTLHLITYETAEMEKLVKEFVPGEYHQQIFCRTMTNRQEIADLLSSVEYGFLIRDDDPINNVSSPIKLAEYLSCGVNVILSKAVLSYSTCIEKEGGGIIVENDDDIRKIFSHTYSETAAFRLYRKFFDRQMLINRYKQFLQ